MLVVLAACSDPQLLPDIDATVEARVAQALAALPPPPVEIVKEVEVIVEKPVEVVIVNN